MAMELEKIVGEYFGVSQSLFYSNDKHRTRQECEALHFLWYILRKHKNMTYGMLAKQYHKTRRNVIFETQKISYGVNNQRYYRDTYNDLCDYIAKRASLERETQKE